MNVFINVFMNVFVSGKKKLDGLFMNSCVHESFMNTFICEGWRDIPFGPKMKVFCEGTREAAENCGSPRDQRETGCIRPKIPTAKPFLHTN